jgi:tetratricopeptide (TPR) repeat protein
MKGKILFLILILTGCQLAADEGWSIHEDKTYNFSIKYPSDWMMTTDINISEPLKLLVAFVKKSSGSTYRSNFFVAYVDKGYSMSAQNLAEIQLISARSQSPDLEVLSRGIVKGTNTDGYSLTIEVSSNGIKMTQIQGYFVRGEEAFIVALSCNESQFKDYESTFKEILRSFTFLISEKKVNDILSEAMKSYYNGDFSSAKSKFEEAKKGYQQLKKNNKVEECDNFIEKAEGALSAESKEEEAQILFKEERYDESKSKFSEAKLFYENFGFSGRAETVRYWISLCDKEIKLKKDKEEADKYYEEATILFRDKNYEEAITKFSEAKTKYELVGDAEKAKQCDEWIKKSEEAGVTIIPVFIALIIVLFIFKRKH